MSARAPLLSFLIGICIVLAGTAFGLRQDQSDAASLTTSAAEAAAPAALPDTTVTETVAAVAPAVAPVVAPVAPTVAAADALPTPKDAPVAMVIPEMKHVWQSLNNCGPAAVVMALSTFGVDANQEVARLALRGPDVRRGMGPQGVDAWVKDNFGLRSMWRNNGTNDLMRRLVANRCSGTRSLSRTTGSRATGNRSRTATWSSTVPRTSCSSRP
jgi:hypothetical protein